MTDDKHAEAINVVARRVVVNEWKGAVEQAERSPDYPHLTDDHWEAILTRCEVIIEALDPTEDEFFAAHEHLTGELP